MLKRVLEELGETYKAVSAACVRARISDAKNQLIDGETYRSSQGPSKTWSGSLSPV